MVFFKITLVRTHENQEKSVIKTCFWVLSAWVYNVCKKRTFMVISKTHLSECMKIAKKHVINIVFVQTCMCRRCRRKDAFCESIGNALKETGLSWIINTIYIVLPLYQCPYTPSRQRFSLSLEVFSGAITFNVRVDFKLYTPLKTEVFSRFGSVLRSDNIQR